MYRTNGESPLGYQFGEDASFGIGLTHSSSSRFRWSAQFAWRFVEPGLAAGPERPGHGDHDAQPGARRPRARHPALGAVQLREDPDRHQHRRRAARARRSTWRSASERASRRMPRPRLWPAVLVLLLGALVDRPDLAHRRLDPAVAHGRDDRDVDRRRRSLLVAWLAFFSRLSRRGRGSCGLAITAARARARAGLLPHPGRDRRPAADRGAALRPAPPRCPSRSPRRRAAEPPPDAVPAGREPRCEPRRLTPRAPAQPPTPAAAAAAPAFPQFLGPSRDGTLAGPRLARDWTTRPPRRLWRQPLGQGWAGFAISGASRRDAGAARRRGARGGVRRRERPAALVARRPRALRDGDRGRRPARDAHARRRARVRDGRHRDPERARPRERASACGRATS